MALPLPAIAIASEWAFFLDLDGTLFEITDRPDQVRVPPELPVLLRGMVKRFDGAIGIVTGRTIADADRLLAPLKLTIAGIHGAELRTHANGRIRKLAAPVDPALAAVVRKLERLSPQLIIENKGLGLAVHFRRVPEAGPAIAAALASLAEKCGHDLKVRNGRMVCEIVPAGVSKEAALQHMLTTARFRGRRPVMIGDDQTDEAAIVLAAHIGGVGLKVGGEHFGGKESHFDDPAHVRSWLGEVVRRVQ